MRNARHAWITVAALMLAAAQVAVAADQHKPAAARPPIQQPGSAGGMRMMDMPMMKEHMAQMREHMQ